MMKEIAKDVASIDEVIEVVTLLSYKVDKLADDMNWDELRNMVVDQMFSEPITAVTPETLTHARFLIRLCIRCKSIDKSEFNRVSFNEMQNRFCITNYDYKTFKWAIDQGFSDTIDNNCIYMPADKLTAAQVAAFKKKIK